MHKSKSVTNQKWDERYRRGENLGTEPAPLLVRFTRDLAPGRALDLASGPGRNAVWLASQGWRVVAIDNSEVALDLLRLRARGTALEPRFADLESGAFTLAPDSWELICDFYFLHRSLFPKIRAAVVPGGLVVAAIHTEEDAAGMPAGNPAYLLKPGELRDAFAGWEILHSFEGAPGEGAYRRRTAEIVARKPTGAKTTAFSI